jgi:hypothetical protein
MTIPKPTFRDIMWMVIIAVLLFFWLKSCGNDQGAALAKTLQEKDSIIAHRTASAEIDKQERIAEATKRWEAQIERRIDSIKADSLQKIVNLVSRQAMRLSGELIDLRNALPDSSWVYVAPRYIEGCDSLADVVPVLVNQNKQLQEVQVKKDIGFLKELSLLEQQRNSEKKRADTAQKDFNELKGNYAYYVRVTQSHNSWWIGAELGGSALYQQAGGKVGFQTKKGTMYIVTTGIHSLGGTYASGSVLFKLSLRKK